MMQSSQIWKFVMASNTTNFYEFEKCKIREIWRILKPEVTNFQSMIKTEELADPVEELLAFCAVSVVVCFL